MGKRIAARGSLVAMKLVRAITLRLKKVGASLLTSLNISGEENAMTDIPSRSFGSNISWFCKNDTDLLNLFNKNFPLPNQASWNVLSPSNSVSMKVISVLWMQHLEMFKWLQIRKERKHVGKIGVTLSDIWDWSLGYRMPHTRSEFGASHALQLVYTQADMVKENNLQLAQYLGSSSSLEIRSLWPMKATTSKHKDTKRYF